MKNFLFSNVERFRYERKFYIEGLTTEEIEAILKFHTAIFKEIYHQRIVNNIYFDSHNLQHYFDSIDGAARRLKIRIRWYGNLFGFIKDPVLELKIKHNLHVGKLRYPLKPFILDDNFSIDVIRKAFKESSLGENLRSHLIDLNFSLLNTYKRKYFLSSNRKYRITIDSDMQIYRLLSYQNCFLHKLTDYTDAILEIKYNKSQDKFVDGITNYFPFRMSKSSKYVDGVAKLYA